MITYQQVSTVSDDFLKEYESIPMLVEVDKILQVEKIDHGVGGVLFTETAVQRYANGFGSV